MLTPNLTNPSPDLETWRIRPSVEILMHGNLVPRLGRFLVCGVLAVAAAVVPAYGPSVARAQTVGSLSISPDSGAVGSKLQVHGTGFQHFSLITNMLDLTVFDATNTIVEHGSIAANDDGTIEATIDTSNAQYASGTYSLLASYTYWAVRRDPVSNVTICDFCPTKTVPLVEPVTFTLE
jgi:hypothetical protein